MKIRTYVAKDMRQALRMVREEQGPDAVILSTRAVAQGVEVAAAVDFEAVEQLPRLSPATDVPSGASAYGNPGTARVTSASPAAAHRDFAALLGARTPIAEPQEEASPDTSESRSAAGPDLGAEVRSLRYLLENQLAQLAWNDLTRRAPVQAEILTELTQLGFGQELATDLVCEMPDHLPFTEAQRHVLAQIARRVCVRNDEWLETGGRVALVGPTGVGKTTALAKLAARWILRHGARELAIISVDSDRIGAQEQIAVLGRVLGVQTFTIDEVSELPGLLASLADRKLVLIDTAGVSPRDADLQTRLAALRQAHPELQTCLVLAASAQAGMIEESIVRFAAATPASCLITKLDEAASLGGVLTALIRAQLPIAYVSDGQRIPEDLSTARAHQLVARAVQLASSSKALATEDLLARRFGGVAHVIA